MKYYQLMSGDQTRDFSNVMYDFGVAIVGPGDFGPIYESVDTYKDRGEWSKLSWLSEIQPGDRIVLHSGQSFIQAIGEVKEVHGKVYHFSSCFSDIDGWDLSHFCYVNWKIVNHTLPGRTLSRATVARVNQENVIQVVNDLWDKCQDIITPKFPVGSQLPSAYSPEILENELIEFGMRIDDAENTVRTLSKVEKLANWYVTQERTTEHEIRAFIVIPLLYALGWSYQRMAVEYDKLDIALFPNARREKPTIIFETKTMWSGSALGVQQVRNYIKHKADLLSDLKKVVITDGLTYWLYDAANLEHPFTYMSLRTKLLRNPAYPTVGGMIEFIKHILPN